MKKIYFSSLLLLLGVIVNAQSLHVNNFTVDAGSETTINVYVSDFSDNYIAAGMILQMPEGMSIVSDGTGFKVTLNADVIENHIVKSTMTDNNCFKFAVFSSTNSELNLRKNGNFGIGNTLQGKLFYTIQIKAPNKAGIYNCHLSNIEFATSSFNLINLAETSFQINVNLTGDVNNDGTVDISDVVALVNFILSTESTEFDNNSADINKDGYIDISDVVALVNIILGTNQ